MTNPRTLAEQFAVRLKEHVELLTLSRSINDELNSSGYVYKRFGYNKCKADVMVLLDDVAVLLSAVKEEPAPPLTWEYVGEELAIFWTSPYGNGKEKIASFWWPAHPVEATAEVEAMFERYASRLASPSSAPAINHGK